MKGEYTITVSYVALLPDSGTNPLYEAGRSCSKEAPPASVISARVTGTRLRVDEC